MSDPLHDQVIVITGASGGIGAALARQVAARGARPVLAARRAEALHEVAATCAGEALVVPTDVTQRAAVEALCAAALAHHGRIDAWVNNAGQGISRPPSALTDEDIDAMVTVNLKSALYGTQAVLPHFKERGRGVVINVSSMLGRIPWAPIRSAYSATKAALNSLTASFRVEHAAQWPGLVFGVFTPGVVATDFGRNARGGGLDNRQLPGAQDVEEVAAALADQLAHPQAEAYSRPGYAAQVAAYYADMGAYEQAMLRR